MAYYKVKRQMLVDAIGAINRRCGDFSRLTPQQLDDRGSIEDQARNDELEDQLRDLISKF